MGITRQRNDAARILACLAESYPEAACALVFRNPYELLVATILSAQCTDVRVNMVTPQLFAHYPDAATLATAEVAALENIIHSTGFYHNKAKNLLGCALRLVKHHGGEVPRTMAELSALPGVGRKTANVVLGNAFGIPGMVVDTHVGRVAGRLGWSRANDPVKIEADLCRLLPDESWTLTSHLLIAHGRACCKAPTPHCSRCPVSELCPHNGVVRQR